MGTPFTKWCLRFVSPPGQGYACPMRIALIIAGLLVSLVAQPQEIYRWVDKDGIVHYADQPGAPDAQRMEYASRAPAGDAGSPAPLYEQQTPRIPERPPYSSLNITSPTPDQVFFGGDVTVPIAVELDTRLREGDELVIFVDAKRVPEVSGFGATVTGLARGTHFMRAAVLDPAGDIVISSPQITFHLRQTSIASPPAGPSLKPPTRPGSPAS